MELITVAITVVKTITGDRQLRKLGRRSYTRPTGEHDMLQPVGQGINTQSILAAGCCIVSGMACENV